MNSWALSACYPQSSFYPLSDGHSILNHRITMTQFPTCSTCKSHSQAPLYHYTLNTISNRAEGTVARLRYLLGGDRPSQTAHLTLSSNQVHGYKLEESNCKGSIPPLTPLILANKLQSLLPMLYKQLNASILSYSKASWGLSVQSRQEGVFTLTRISPSLQLRQSRDGYTIQAGRNLPDKEFRYLRTVIVTAAIHWGFSQELHIAANPLL